MDQGGARDRFDVVGLGYCSEDTLMLVDRYPARDSKAEIRKIVVAGGGQTATALVALRRFGLRVAFHGRVGGDEAGARALAWLRDEDVDVRGAIVTPCADTQKAFIVIDGETHERTIFWRRPKELEMSEADVDADLVRRARCLHVDGHERGALQALRIAREARIITSMDAEKATELQREMLPLVDLLCVAAPFPRILLGTDDPEEALPRLHAMGPREVVVTLGARGAIGFDGREIVRAPALSIAGAIDSTGAGDVFHAAHVFGTLASWPLSRKLRFANAAAGLSLRGIGGRAAIPTLSDVEALVATRSGEGY